MGSPLNYQNKLNQIKNYTTLGINSKKYYAKNPKFTRREKWLISRYYNLTKESGWFEYNQADKELVPKVKFVKSKKKKQKGAPKLAGYVIQGANPGDKIRGGKIIKENYEKTFIPLDFSSLIEAEAEFKAEYPGEEFDDYHSYIEDEIRTALDPHYDELTEGSYFTIVLLNGWELGQNKRKSTLKNKRKDGQAIARDLSFDKKIDNLVEKIEELFMRASNKYNVSIIKGIYLWNFTKQRKPTKKEKSVIKSTKRKRRRK